LRPFKSRRDSLLHDDGAIAASPISDPIGGGWNVHDDEENARVWQATDRRPVEKF